MDGSTTSPLSGAAARPCVFLDRDGTLNEEMGYLNHPSRLVLLPGVAEAVARLNAAGVLAIVLSNQAGVARGYFSEEVLTQTMARMERLLAAGGARLDAIYYAPFHPSSKDPRYREDPEQLRKPGLGMIHRARREWPVDMTRAYMVGDRVKDVVFAHKAGVKGIMVQTGYGLGEVTYDRPAWPTQPDHLAENLPAAVDWILKDLQSNATGSHSDDL